MPMSNWIGLIVLIVIVSPVVYLALEPKLEKKSEQRNILANGQAAIGTVVAVEERESTTAGYYDGAGP
jgi:hypothetical protein